VTRLPARLMETWRSLDTTTRVLIVSGAVLLCAAVIAVAYLVLQRPGDILDESAQFKAKEKRKLAKEHVNWPLYGFDLERTRYLPAEGVEPPFEHRFLFDAGELLEFSPILVDGVLYVMNKDAVFFAIDAGNGKVVWKRDLGQLGAAAPAYEDGKLYVVTLEPGAAMALRAKDGKRLWTRPLPGRSESSPLVRNGVVYFGAESGDLYAVKAKNGSDVWHIDTAGSVKAGPAFHDGTIYVGDYAGHMYAVRASDGAVRWDTTDLGVGFGRSGRFYATPAVAFGRVYAGNADGRVYSFEESSGDIAWTHSTGDLVYSAPAVADTPGTPPTVYIGSANGVFFALNADDGSEIWRSEPFGGIISGAASVIGDIVYVSAIGTQKTKGFAVGDGEVVYSADRGEYNPVISDGNRIWLTGYAGITKLTPKEPREKKGGGKGGKNRPGKGKKKGGKGKDGGGEPKGKDGGGGKAKKGKGGDGGPGKARKGKDTRGNRGGGGGSAGGGNRGGKAEGDGKGKGGSKGGKKKRGGAKNGD
jgi:outer membrane protein assembly factor BamB